MNILETIAAKARERVAAAKEALPLAAIKERAEEKAAAEQAAGGFAFPFEQALQGPDVAFICEVKKASPSKGIIAEDFPYLQIAKDYEAAGAAAISCLTEPYWFLGSDRYLQEITCLLYTSRCV